MSLRPVYFISIAALCASSCCAQASNPAVAGQDSTQVQGRALFRSNCAFCHGATGRGGRGPSLVTGRIAAAADSEIRSIVLNGIAGTNMPAFSSLEKDEMDALIAHIKTLANSSAPASVIQGDAAAGRDLYRVNGCANCHRIGNDGGLYGPELTRVGSGRSVEYLKESVTSPSADIPQEFEGIIVTTAAGKKIQGIRINEDTFTVQMRLINGKFAAFDKTKAKAVDHPTESFMPAYHLAAKDLDNLVAYLQTLRGPVQTGIDAEKAKGIK